MKLMKRQNMFRIFTMHIRITMSRENKIVILWNGKAKKCTKQLQCILSWYFVPFLITIIYFKNFN